MTATMSPKRPRKRATVCGVNEISGTSTHAVRPAASVASMACRYTSVLPEPVTPSTSTTSPAPRCRAPSMAASAAACPGVSGGLGLGTKSPACASSGSPACMPRMRRRCSMTTTPCFSSVLSGEDTAPNSADSSATRSSPRSSAATMDACFTAFLRGSKSENDGPGTTQRSSTSPTEGSSSRQ